MQEEI